MTRKTLSAVVAALALTGCSGSTNEADTSSASAPKAPATSAPPKTQSPKTAKKSPTVDCDSPDLTEEDFYAHCWTEEPTAVEPPPGVPTDGGGDSKAARAMKVAVDEGYDPRPIAAKVPGCDLEPDAPFLAYPNLGQARVICQNFAVVVAYAKAPTPDDINEMRAESDGIVVGKDFIVTSTEGGAPSLAQIAKATGGKVAA